ncbi:hypothetical protein KUTeg_006674 [Tegillarca granosa]|uniref:Telomere-length maintenance and DNA damage repair domain-containing protein n=1 Tax=Tegillarca granosa TaxID=220873 RepID=A0ABQ9FB03_TEGGR|nr:hypothetical protein KUTeg_006674 [Tegillarca granosa]
MDNLSDVIACCRSLDADKVTERKAVCIYVNIETAAIQKGKEPQSATAQSNREKKKQEVSALFKFVVKQANKRGPRLKCLALLNSILDVLGDEKMCEAYGLDYSNVLLKNFITVRKYWVEISPDRWQVAQFGEETDYVITELV